MVAVIAGPTASGKSALALALARDRRGTIINADASQLYADLRIITARPSPQEAAAVPHRLYGVLDGDHVASAAVWVDLARAAIAETLAEGRLPILVGGTGLYLRALIDGIAPVPAIPDDIRETVRALPPAVAAAALAREDPAMAARLKPGDRQRIARALEVTRATGRSLLAWQAEPTGGIAASHDVRAMRIDLPRAELNARADRRLAAMAAAGALNEVAALLARRLSADRPVLRALGVPEFAAVLAGEMTLPEGIAAAALATRRYQKRQQTWGRNQTPDWSAAAGDASDLIGKLTIASVP
jgi:tRNA dimethylallyltransferase